MTTEARHIAKLTRVHPMADLLNSTYASNLDRASYKALGYSVCGITSPALALQTAYKILSEGNARRFVMVADALSLCAFDDSTEAVAWLAGNAQLTGTNGAVLAQSGRSAVGVKVGGEVCYLFRI